MDRVRGLPPKTRSLSLRIVGRLLISRIGDDAINVAAITPDHVRRFFAEQTKLYSKPATAGTVVDTLRGYVRYRASLGNVVHGVIGALVKAGLPVDIFLVGLGEWVLKYDTRNCKFDDYFQ